MNKSLLIKGLSVALLAGVLAGAASAADSAKWKVRVGVTNVNPKSNNGTVAGAKADVKDDTAVTFNGVYMLDDNWGVELLAATPFKHDIALAGLGKVGSTKHLPPTLSAQYYFNNNSAFTPYLGLGLNYTYFFSERATGPIAGSKLSLDPSFGLAFQAGVDYDINDQWLVNVDVRYVDIEADVKIDGAASGKANIDPMVVGLNIGYKF